MIQNVLANRLKEYAPADALEQENVLQELMQHYVLASLSRAKFFAQAGFHGGTCLRILYSMNRFSEDLDFVLKAPDPKFEWEAYLERIRRDFIAEDIDLVVGSRGGQTSAGKKVFLKTDSIGQILNLDLPYTRRTSKKIRMKLEVDTNPPAGAALEARYITFPRTAAITAMDLSSGFGSKCGSHRIGRLAHRQEGCRAFRCVTRATGPRSVVSGALLAAAGWTRGSDPARSLMTERVVSKNTNAPRTLGASAIKCGYAARGI